jgi:hypothetical protein
MADSSTKTTPTSKGKSSVEEPKRSLPVGHPQAGYVPPDLSFRDSAGLSEDEDEALEEQTKERDKLVAAVEEHEHKVATEEAEAAEKEAKEREKEAASK